MNESPVIDRARRIARFLCWHAVFALAVWCAVQKVGVAQETGPIDSDALAQQKLAAPAEADQTDSAAPDVPLKTPEMPSLLQLFRDGGILMWPILAMSFVVVIFGCERLIGLRTRRVIPPQLVRQLRDVGAKTGELDPKFAYKLCTQYPSATANVLKAVLLKLGRPHSEVESAMKDASDREANRLFNNVRPINLAATVAPLLGLLGTVQGMIYAFFVTANLPTGANKAQHLASGIYVALVTTFAGLVVAIPAVMIAHFFEGRIQRLFRSIDEFLFGILAQLERFEGKQRVTTSDLEREKPVMRRPVEHVPLTVPVAKE